VDLSGGIELSEPDSTQCSEQEERPSQNVAGLPTSRILVWLLVFVVVVFSLVVAWKLLTLPASAVQLQFGFTDLLALILAVFAVGLSAAFYFRSTKDSNQFFENVYLFTKDVSVVLGKIEAGFGERLRHLDEGYSSMLDRFDTLPETIKASQRELDTSEDALVKVQKERDDILRTMVTTRAADKSKIDSLAQELQAKDEQIAELRHEVVERGRTLRRNLQPPADLSDRERSYRGLERYLFGRVVQEIGPRALREMKHAEIAKAFAALEPNLLPQALHDMVRLGLYSVDTGTVTREGTQLLKRLAFEMGAPGGPS
jgi:hypothetical protein